MREIRVEKDLIKRLEAEGGLCLKFVSPGRSGVPDRICIHPQLGVFFVEVKAPSQRTRKLQDAVIKKMRAAGAVVYVADSFESVDQLTQEVHRRGSV